MSESARYLLFLRSWLTRQPDQTDSVVEGMYWRLRVTAVHLIGFMA